MFSVHSLADFSSNPGKVHFGVLLHLFIYIRNNNNLGLIYYSKIEYSSLSDILRQAIINSENQFMVFSDSRWQDCPYTVISTGAYTFYQGGPIGNCTHVPGPVAQSSS